MRSRVAGLLVLAFSYGLGSAHAAPGENAKTSANAGSGGGGLHVEAAALGRMFFAPDGGVAGMACHLGILNPTFGDSASLGGGVMLGMRLGLSPEWALALPVTLASNGSNSNFAVGAGVRRVFGRLDFGISAGLRYAVIGPRLICGEDTGVSGQPSNGFFAPMLGADARLELFRIGEHVPVWLSLGVQVDWGFASHADEREITASTGDQPVTATITTQDSVSATPVLLLGVTF